MNSIEKTEADEVCTKKELAYFLRVSVRTIDNLVRTKRIPFFKLNRTIRFDKSAVLAALKHPFIYLIFQKFLCMSNNNVIRPGITAEFLQKSGVHHVTNEEALQSCGKCSAGLMIPYFEFGHLQKPICDPDNHLFCSCG